MVRVPLRDGGAVKFTWIGDLDGDGEYDYVIDRQTSPQSIEAYRSDGTFLWEVDLGPNSTNQDNIEPGSSTIDVGHNDGVTVYDLDSDGRAEVALRIANGVTFGDGASSTHADDNRQFIAILDGRTGALAQLGRHAHRLPGRRPDGRALRRGLPRRHHAQPGRVHEEPHGDGAFNLMIAAWRFTGRTL